MDCLYSIDSATAYAFLDVSVLQHHVLCSSVRVWSVLSLYMSLLKQPVLPQEVSVQKKPVLPLDVSVLKQPVLFLELSCLVYSSLSALDVSVPQQPLLSYSPRRVCSTVL